VISSWKSKKSWGDFVGRIVNSRSLTTKELLRLVPPIILCTDKPNFERIIAENGYRQISINLPLAQSLTGLEPKDIRTIITDKIRGILPQGESVYLTDYEMLFDPRYEIDILRLFIDLARRNKLIVKWCGKVDGDMLTYAEQGYADYKQYKMNDYDVVIVV